MPRTTTTPTAVAVEAAMKVLGAASGFAVGDTVKLVRLFDENNAALGCCLDLELDESFIGMTFKVTEKDYSNDGSFQLDHDYWVPWYCIEFVCKATSVELNEDYTAVISKDGKKVEVGCQEISADKVLELADRIREVQASQPVKRAPAKKAVKKAVRRRTTNR